MKTQFNKKIKCNENKQLGQTKRGRNIINIEKLENRQLQLPTKQADQSNGEWSQIMI
jgi:hypothetical protein